MKSQILQFKSILLLLLIVSLNGQPKLSVDLGTGFYEPTMKGFDSNELISVAFMNFFLMPELDIAYLNQLILED